jgi:hypothetical protein
MLRAESRGDLRVVIESVRSAMAAFPRTIGAQIDVDPMQLL